MFYVGTFLICFLASIIGAICGLGGGLLIKPVMDAFGVLDVATVSFLSGCTVLIMTTYTVCMNLREGVSRLDRRISLPLALGSVLGGVAGKHLFSVLAGNWNLSQVGRVQAVCLLLIVLITMLYTVNKSRLPSYHFQNPLLCTALGGALGVMASFLGIGGGPVNLMVFFLCFSMQGKTAAENSLYVILFSQAASLIFSLLGGTVPEFPIPLLVLMGAGAILGGALGRAVNRRIDDRAVERLFLLFLLAVAVLNVFNIVRFSL